MFLGDIEVKHWLDKIKILINSLNYCCFAKLLYYVTMMWLLVVLLKIFSKFSKFFSPSTVLGRSDKLV